MNKKELIETVASDTGMSGAAAARAVEAVLDVVAARLAGGRPTGSRRASVVIPPGAQQILVLPHAKAVAADVDDVAVVQETVDERRGHHLVAEHPAALPAPHAS